MCRKRRFALYAPPSICIHYKHKFSRFCHQFGSNTILCFQYTKKPGGCATTFGFHFSFFEEIFGCERLCVHKSSPQLSVAGKFSERPAGRTPAPKNRARTRPKSRKNLPKTALKPQQTTPRLRNNRNQRYITYSELLLVFTSRVECDYNL